MTKHEWPLMTKKARKRRGKHGWTRWKSIIDEMAEGFRVWADHDTLDAEVAEAAIARFVNRWSVGVPGDHMTTKPSAEDYERLIEGLTDRQVEVSLTRFDPSERRFGRLTPPSARALSHAVRNWLNAVLAEDPPKDVTEAAQIVNGWIMDEQPRETPWRTSVASLTATHLLSGVSLSWSEPDHTQISPPPTIEPVSLLHPTGEGRPISGPIATRSEARDFIKSVIEGAK